MLISSGSSRQHDRAHTRRGQRSGSRIGSKSDRSPPLQELEKAKKLFGDFEQQLRELEAKCAEAERKLHVREEAFNMCETELASFLAVPAPPVEVVEQQSVADSVASTLQTVIGLLAGKSVQENEIANVLRSLAEKAPDCSERKRGPERLELKAPKRMQPVHSALLG